MNNIVKKLFVILCLCGFGGYGLSAQLSSDTNARSYDEGSVWVISYVFVESHNFNTYMDFLDNVFRPIHEVNLKSGRTLSFKILEVPYARDGEANVIILEEFKNMAALDFTSEELDKAYAPVEDFSTVQKSTAEIRKIKGEVLSREIILHSTK